MAKILHDVITVCRGCVGINGRDGINGHNGVTFTPVVKDNGRVLGWMNDGCYANPPDIDLYKLVGEASGDENVIEQIKVNGTELPVSDRTVDIEIPENVSAFNNDAGYLTEHQSLANYYNKTEVYNQNESDAKYATKTELEVVNNKFVTVFRYRGSKPRYEDLPTTDNQIGDVWNVGSTLDGPNYVWTGEAWDLLGHASTGFGDVSGIDGSFSCVPLPHLTLTAVKPDGVDQTVQIDMSCLKNMVDSAVSDVATRGTFDCTYEVEPQKYEIGVAIGDGDGDFTSFIKIDFTIKPTQTATGALSVRFGADGPGGLALLSPYTSGITVYQSTVPDNVQYFRDATCLSDTSFHFVQTLGNKLTIEMWIEQAATAGYHNLWIKAYGPKAPNVPRVTILKIGNTVTRHINNITDGSSTLIPVYQTNYDLAIETYPLQSYVSINDFGWTAGTVVNSGSSNIYIPLRYSLINNETLDPNTSYCITIENNSNVAVEIGSLSYRQENNQTIGPLLMSEGGDQEIVEPNTTVTMGCMFTSGLDGSDCTFEGFIWVPAGTTANIEFKVYLHPCSENVGTINIYPRTSTNIRYYGGEFSNYYTGSVAYETLTQGNTYTTDFGTNVTLLSNGNVQVSVPENNIDLWPTELISAILTLTTNNYTSTVSLNCMLNWLNNQLARIQTINDSIIDMIADVTNETSEHINDMFEGTSTNATNTYNLANETTYNIQDLFAN